MKLNIYKKTYPHKIFILCCMTLILFSCKKAENYYDKLSGQPEILTDYQTIYGVGDTLTIKGRLGINNNLHIRIGNIDAPILEALKVRNTTLDAPDLDLVKVLIKQEMGIGTNRPIEISSGGNTITPPTIEIYEGANIGILPNPLKLIEHFRFSTGAIPLYCQNGKGTVFIWEVSKTISRVTKQGVKEELINASALVDNYGSFSITTFNCGGVDPQEQNLYFSAITTDNSVENSTNEIYRLCRFDLRNKTLTTLNRTLYPKTANQRTLASAMPFEGSVTQSRIYKITGIYPDKEGNVYFNLMSHFITKMTNDNTYRYVFKTRESNAAFIPEILNPTTNVNYFGEAIHDLFPGVNIYSRFVISLNPVDKLFYGAQTLDGGNTLTQYDLENKVQLYQLPRPFLNISELAAPYISGSFKVLTGVSNEQASPNFFGYMPITKDGLLVLNYQSLDGVSTDAQKEFYKRFSMPAWSLLDFKLKRGIRYAPGSFIRGNYKMLQNDRLLNYDEDGMLYMTANSNATIVKTTYQ